ncbi:MAG: hypothetical protein WD358_02385 [Nitriliruptoraceae bacterium]
MSLAYMTAGPVTSLPAVIGHAGPGSVWQAMVVVAGIMLAITVLAIATRLLKVDDLSDLALPAAAAVAIASLGAIGDGWISDGIGWGLPIAVVAAVALLIHVTTPVQLDGLSPLTGATLAVGIVTVTVLSGPLTVALHPPVEVLPLADDAEVAILVPADGQQVTGDVEIVVRVRGGTIGPGAATFEAWAAMSEVATHLGVINVYIDGDRRDAEWSPQCSATAPCDEVSTSISLSGGNHAITVEFVRGDGTPLAPAVTDRVTVEVD